MKMLLHINGLPSEATTMHLRGFFRGFNIPGGGIYIPGDGHAFITFGTNEDLLQSMTLNGRSLCGTRLKLSICTEQERDTITRELMLESKKGPKEFYLKMMNVDPFAGEREVKYFFGSLADSISQPNGVALATDNGEPVVFVKFENEQDYDVALLMDGRKMGPDVVSIRKAQRAEFELALGLPVTPSVAPMGPDPSRDLYDPFDVDRGRGRPHVADPYGPPRDGAGEPAQPYGGAYTRNNDYPPKHQGKPPYMGARAPNMYGDVPPHNSMHQNASTSQPSPQPSSNDPRAPGGCYIMLDLLPSWATEHWIRWFLNQRNIKNGYICIVYYQAKALYAYVQVDSERDVQTACTLHLTKVGSDEVKISTLLVDKVRKNLQNLPAHLRFVTYMKPQLQSRGQPSNTRGKGEGIGTGARRDPYSQQGMGYQDKRYGNDRGSYDNKPGVYRPPRRDYIREKSTFISSKDKYGAPGAKKPKLDSTEPESHSAHPPAFPPALPVPTPAKMEENEDKQERLVHEMWGDYGELELKDNEEILTVTGLPLSGNLTPKDVINWLAQTPRKIKAVGHFNVFRKLPFEGSPYMVDVVEMKIEHPPYESLPKMGFVRSFSARFSHKSQSKSCPACRRYDHDKVEPSMCPAASNTGDCYYLENKGTDLLAPCNRVCMIRYGGVEHLSVEHAYMWIQARALFQADVARKIVDSHMDKRFKEHCQELHRYKSLNWERSSLKRLKELFTRKCEKSYKFRTALLGTADKTIVYVHTRCTLGIGATFTKKIQTINPNYFSGLNLVGNALMDVRKELKNKSETPKQEDVIVIEDNEEDEEEGGEGEEEEDFVMPLIYLPTASAEMVKIEGLPIGPKYKVDLVTDWLMSDPRNLEILDEPQVSSKVHKNGEVTIVSVSVQGPVNDPVLPTHAIIGKHIAVINHKSQRAPSCKVCTYKGHETGDRACKAFKINDGFVQYFGIDSKNELSPNCSNMPIMYGGMSHSSVVHAFVWKMSEELAKIGIKGDLTYTTGTMRRREPCLDADRIKIMQWEYENYDLWKSLYIKRWETSQEFRQAIANTKKKDIVYLDHGFVRGIGTHVTKNKAQYVDPAFLIGLNYVGKTLMELREEKRNDPLMPEPMEIAPDENDGTDAPVIVIEDDVPLTNTKQEELGNKEHEKKESDKGQEIKRKHKFSVEACIRREKELKETKNLRMPDTYNGPLDYEPLDTSTNEEVVQFEGFPLSNDFPPELAIEWLKAEPRRLIVLGDYVVYTRPPSEKSDYEVYVVAVKVQLPINPVLEKKVIINGFIGRVSHRSQTNNSACIACRNLGHKRQDTDVCPAYTTIINSHFVENLKNVPLSPCCIDEPVEYEGYRHQSVNHAYTWREALDLERPDIAEEIKLAQENKAFQTTFNNLHMYEALNWELGSYDLLKELYLYRWHNSKTFRQSLIGTGNMPIVFIHATITRGIGMTGKNKVMAIKAEYYPGKNIVGKVLEDIRMEMRNWKAPTILPGLEIKVDEEKEEGEVSDSEQPQSQNNDPTFTEESGNNEDQYLYSEENNDVPFQEGNVNLTAYPVEPSSDAILEEENMDLSE